MDTQLAWLLPVTAVCVLFVIHATRVQRRQRDEHAALMKRLGFLDRTGRAEELQALAKTFGRIEATAFSRRLDGFTLWQALDYDSDGPGALFWGVVFHRQTHLPVGVTLVPIDAYTGHALLLKSIDFLMKASGLANNLPVPPSAGRFKAYSKSSTWPNPLPDAVWDLLNRHPHPLRVEFKADAIRITPIIQRVASTDLSKDTKSQAEFVERLADAMCQT